MPSPTVRVVLTLISLPVALAAQHGAGAPATAPAEVHQLDFLLGQWELTVSLPPQGLAQRIHGAPKLVGTWTASRALDGFGLVDELRITDLAGNPLLLSHSVRIFDRAARRWKVSQLDVYRGRFSTAVGEWRDDQLSLSSEGRDADGTTYLARTRLFDITPTSFRFQQDRSVDAGKTWTQGALRIEARRVTVRP